MMNISYKIVESSSEDLKTILKAKPQFVMLVPSKSHCIAIVPFNENVPIGVVIAYQRMQKDLHIHNIFVSSDYQRNGIGTKLLKDIETLAKEKGFKTLSLIVANTNLTAMTLYTKMGFNKDLKSLEGFWTKRII